MARRFLLVDAHNVIFARPDLARQHGRNPGAARGQLTRILERYQDATGIRVVAVFDGGTGTQATHEMSGQSGIQAMYPQAGQTADAIIERLVAKYASIHDLTVATNDNLIRAAAAAAGATIIDADTLFDEIVRADRDLTASLERLRKRK